MRDLLALSMANPTEPRIDAALALYKQAGWELMGYTADDTLVGVLGIEVTDYGRGTIRHIAVDPAYRRRGIAATMIQLAMHNLRIQHLRAEAGADAVGFFRRLGCEVVSLGVGDDGVERFSCAWSPT